MTVTTFRTVKNNVSVALLNAALAGDATWTVTAGQGAQYPAVPFFVSCDSEVAICTARAGDVLTVTRGQDGTAAAGHGAGALVEIRPIAGLFAELQAAINALEAANNGWRANQFVNPSFEIWQRGNGPWTTNGSQGADRWVQQTNSTGSTFSVSRDGVNSDGSGAAATVTYVRGGGAGAVVLGPIPPANVDFYTQILENGGQYSGRQYSASFRVRPNVVGAVRIVSYDSVNGFVARSAFNVGGANVYETLSGTWTWPVGATNLQVGLSFEATATVSVDNATFTMGSQPAPYVPLPPADDWLRCLRYYQRWFFGGANSAIGSGLSQSATVAVVLIPVHMRMGGPPSLTFSAAADFQLLNGGGAAVAPVTGILGLALLQTGIHVQANVAAGLTAGQATLLESANGTGWFAAEWNP